MTEESGVKTDQFGLNEVQDSTVNTDDCAVWLVSHKTERDLVDLGVLRRHQGVDDNAWQVSPVEEKSLGLCIIKHQHSASQHLSSQTAATPSTNFQYT